MPKLTRLLDFIDKRKVVRRSCLYTAVWVNIDAYYWSKEAVVQNVDSTTILVVTGVAAALLATVLKFYNDARINDDKN